jgi:hypothetical protein
MPGSGEGWGVSVSSKVGVELISWDMEKLPSTNENDIPAITRSKEMKDIRIPENAWRKFCIVF